MLIKSPSCIEPVKRPLLVAVNTACSLPNKVELEPYDLRLAWTNDYVRELIERSIINGNFKLSPSLGHEFIKKIDELCKTNIPTDELYKKLRRFFEGLLLRDEGLKNSFSYDREERVRRRITQIKEVLGDFKPSTYLDIGCGDGESTCGLKEELNLPRQKVIGLEVFVRPETNKCFEPLHYNGKDLSVPDNSQDLITIFAVLHHAVEPVHLIKDVYRTLSSNGHVLVREFDTPNYDDWLFQLVMDHVLYKVYTPFPDVPIPGNYFSVDKWQQIFRENGFKINKLVFPELTNPYKPFLADLIKENQ